MKITKQTVYLPVNDEWDVFINDYTLMDINGEYIKNITKKEGYFFTSEQLNEYTQGVIKQTLETAADKAEMKLLIDEDEDIIEEANIDKQSITNTFEETYNKLKV